MPCFEFVDAVTLHMLALGKICTEIPASAGRNGGIVLVEFGVKPALAGNAIRAMWHNAARRLGNSEFTIGYNHEIDSFCI